MEAAAGAASPAGRGVRQDNPFARMIDAAAKEHMLQLSEARTPATRLAFSDGDAFEDGPAVMRGLAARQHASPLPAAQPSVPFGSASLTATHAGADFASPQQPLPSALDEDWSWAV